MNQSVSQPVESRKHHEEAAHVTTLLIAVLAGIGFLVAYYTYGRWLGRKIYRLAADRHAAACGGGLPVDPSGIIATDVAT